MADDVELTSNIAVFFRLRPLNKFESNRRSRSVVEVIDDKKLTIEDPASGDLEFDCDGVFEQTSSQEEVYQGSCQKVPQQLLDGCNCLIAAYGPTGSGKSFTLLGNLQADNRVEGLVARAARAVFEQVEKSDPSIEFTIRCSAVEVYLEKIRDLFFEGNNVQVRPDGSITGATSLSCLSVDDVINTTQRAIAARTSSSRDSTRSSSRSTLIIRLQVEQFDRKTDTCKVSKIDFVDLLGSELAACAYSEEDLSESSQLSMSLNYLHNQLKAEIDRQAQGVVAPPIASCGAPLLAKILMPCVGGNVFATFILHASPSNYSVAETVKTVKFGQDCRNVTNRPKVNVWCRWWDCHEKFSISNERQERLISLVNALANGCQRLRDSRGANIGEKSLWDVIRDVQWASKENVRLEFRVESQKEHEAELAKVRLKSDLRRAEKERDEAVAAQRQLQSQLVAAQAEIDQLQDSVTKLQQDLESVRNENQLLELRKNEVEHYLRTSMFRESEAVVFLRQFRRFYFRLLQRTAAQGSGDLLSLAQRIPGAPDLTQLSGIDQMMVESGLLEEDEVGRDASTDPRPSRAALIRSTTAAEQAEMRATQEAAIKEVERKKPEKTLIDQTQLPPPTSIINRVETGEMVEARQKMYETPSGRYIVMREKILEEELLNLSERYMQLEKDLQEERVNVEALTGRTGVAAAFDKMRVAQESRALKEQLEKKENDLKTVIWALNEERMAKKLFQEKLDDRERHITYLEENLSDIQTRMSLTETDKQEIAKKLRDEIQQLKQKIANVSISTWHFSSISSKVEDRVPPIRSRLVVPFTIGSDLNEPTRRSSVGDRGEWIDEALSRSLYKFDFEAEPHGDPSFPVEKSKQEHDARKKAERSVSFSDSVQVTEPAVCNGNGDGYSEDQASETEGEASDDQEELETSPKRSIMDDMFFMDDEETKRGHRTVLHSYDGIVDAYNSVSLNSVSTEKTLQKQSQTQASEPSSPSEPASAILQNEETTDAPSLTYHVKSSGNGVVLTSKSKLGSSMKKTGAKKGPSLSGFMDRLRAKAKNIEDDEKSATPEFMKKFRTIGAKNHAESVIETAGSAPAQEATRTLYGESLKHNSEKRVQDSASSYQNTNKWTPRKKSDDDNDDDLFAREFLRGAVNMSSTMPDDSNSSEEPSDGHMYQHSEVHDTSNPLKNCSPRSSLMKGNNAGSDSESDDESTVAKPVKLSLPAAALSVAPATNKGLGPRSVDSDTDSSEDESTVAPTARLPAPVITQIASATVRSTSMQRENAKSHSESSEDDSTVAKPAKVSIPAAALSITQPKPMRGGPRSVDSDSSDDDSTVAPAVPVATPTAASLAKKIATNNTVAKNTMASQRKANSDSSSDSDSESSDESVAVKTATVSSAVLAMPQIQKVGGGPRSVDSDSSEDESTVAPTAPAPTPAGASPIEKTVSPQREPDSDSDSESESSRDEPTGVATSRPSASISTAKKQDNKKEILGSDSESSDDESTVDLIARGKTRTYNIGPAIALQGTSNTAQKSNYDSDSSEDESTIVDEPKTAQAASAGAVATIKKQVPRKQMEASDSESSDDETDVARPASPITRGNSSVSARQRVESDSDSSDDSKKGNGKKANLLVAANTSQNGAESETDSSDEESVSPTQMNSVRNVSTAGEKSGRRGVDSDDSEESSVEFTHSTKRIPSQPVARSVPEQMKSRDITDVSSGDSAGGEDTSNPDRSQTEQEDFGINATAKQPIDDSSSYEEEVIEESEEGNEIIDLTNHEEDGTRYTPSRTISALGREADSAFAEIRAKQNAARSVTNHSISGTRSGESTNPGSRGISMGEDGFVDSAFSATPFFPQQSAPVAKEPDEEIQMFLGGKTADYKPKRTVPDFGSQITPGVTSGSSSTGGKKKKQSSGKTKFIIKGGKLVKSDGSRVESEEHSESKSGKTKFVIRDGKLVKDDSGLGATLSSMDRLANSNKQNRRMSLESRTDDCDLEMRESRRHELTRKEPRRASMQMNVSGTAQRPKQLRRSSFIIMNGKLVKQEEPRHAPPPTPPKAASFSIVGGKLVKTENGGKKDKSKKRAKTGETKEKKKEKKKKSKDRRPSI